MTREEFEAALDVYEKRTPFYEYNPCHSLEDARDFLWQLMSEGLVAVDNLPEAEEPIDWSKQPLKPLPPDASRYEIMNREVQELKKRRSNV